MSEAWVGGRVTVTSNEHSVTIEIKGGGNKAVVKSGNMLSLAIWLMGQCEKKGVTIGND